MQVEATQYIAKCPRCLKRKSTPQVAPLQPILVSQPLELVHLDYLSLEPSKGNIENVLVITDHFTRYALAYASKTQTAQATARYYGITSYATMGFLNSSYQIKVEILNQI